MLACAKQITELKVASPNKAFFIAVSRTDTTAWNGGICSERGGFRLREHIPQT